MIPFHEARDRVLEQVQPVAESETIAVTAALGRVLAAAVTSPIDVPGHANSGMDGYGVRLADLKPGAETTLPVVADLPAGTVLGRSLTAGEAVRIMTGAPTPEGCDCVVMQEVVRREGSTVVIPPGQKPNQNIRPAGEDIRRGAEVLPPGCRLLPPHLGLLASLGLTEVVVRRQVTVALLSTGDELTPPGQPLAPGHIYDSNRAALAAALTALGVKVLDLGLAPDQRPALAEALGRAGREADAFITSGGVSVGDFDLVKEVLADQGAIEFWKVAMKPGKPQAYGRIGQAAFFGLPGNPVSSLVVFLVMVRPALLKMMGANPEPEQRLRLPLRGRLVKRHDRMDFLRAHVSFDEQGPYVTTTGAQGSGILSSFSRANALLVLSEPPQELNEGDLAEVWLLNYA